MTEIRTTKYGGLGLFATKDYTIGETIDNYQDILLSRLLPDMDDNDNDDNNTIQQLLLDNLDLDFNSNDTNDDDNDDNDTKILSVKRKHSKLQQSSVSSSYNTNKLSLLWNKICTSIPNSIVEIEKYKAAEEAEQKQQQEPIKVANNNTTTASQCAQSDNSSLHKSLILVAITICSIIVTTSTTNDSNHNNKIVSELEQLLTLYHPSISIDKQQTNENEESVQESVVQVVSDLEKNIINITNNVVSYLQQNCKNNSILYKFFHQQNEVFDQLNISNVSNKTITCTCTILLQKVLLIWCCNSFHGGRIYNDTISRINHSCNPNSIIQVNTTTDSTNDSSSSDSSTNNNQQRVVAVTTIQCNTEITISYLNGLYLYSDILTRQKKLQQSKYFICYCTRCYSNNSSSTSDWTSGTNSTNNTIIDIAGAIPCPIQHPRTKKIKKRKQEDSNKKNIINNNSNDDDIIFLLDEDDQYDDDNTVQYLYPQYDSSNTTTFVTPLQYVSINNTSKVNNSSTCTSNTSSINTNDKKYKALFTFNQSIIDKVIHFIDVDQVQYNNNNNNNNSKKRNFNNNNNMKKKSKNDDNETDDDDDDDDTSNMLYISKLQHHIQLASSVLGCKHWTTNILLLFQLNYTLQSFNDKLLKKTLNNGGGNNSKNDDNDDEDDDDDDDDPMTIIAECIDMIQRIIQYMNEIQLQLHIGHVLCNVIIGISRALVGLGDCKSKQYASDWLSSTKLSNNIIENYIPYFESTSIQKVAHSLSNAYKNK